MHTDRLANVALAVLALCALVVTGIFLRREFFATSAGTRIPGGAALTHVEAWKEYARAGARMGGEDAPVTIVEFSDFQCPYCAHLARSLSDLRRRQPGVSVVYRHYPLETVHAQALTAALAAECAGAAGRFEAFHDVVFALQDSIGLLPWTAFADRAGIADTLDFRQCLANRTYADRVSADREAGDKLGVRGTPTVIVNGLRIDGAPSDAELDSLVRAARGVEPRHSR